jgi:hypothetical protein
MPSNLSSSGFRTKILCAFLVPERVTSPAHLSIVILGEDHFAVSYPCCLLTFFKNVFVFAVTEPKVSARVKLCPWVIKHYAVITSGVELYSFLTLALIGGEWIASGLGRLTCRDTNPVPIGQEAWWTKEQVWKLKERELSCSSRKSNPDSSVIQP